MALTGTMDITFTNNFKDLPDELKNIVLSYIDIRKIVSYNDPKIDPFIDAYIKHYIDTRLFTDAAIFKFLYHAGYWKIIEEKLYKMATIWTNDFMEQCEILNEKPDGNPLLGVCFNIKYNFRSIKEGLGPSKTPFKTSIKYFPNPNNRFTIIRDDEYMICPNINKSKVISEMVSSICHFMNMASAGVSQIHSIELVNKYRSSIMNDYDYDDDDDVHIIKKYY